MGQIWLLKTYPQSRMLLCRRKYIQCNLQVEKEKNTTVSYLQCAYLYQRRNFCGYIFHGCLCSCRFFCIKVSDSLTQDGTHWGGENWLNCVHCVNIVMSAKVPHDLSHTPTGRRCAKTLHSPGYLFIWCVLQFILPWFLFLKTSPKHPHVGSVLKLCVYLTCYFCDSLK